MSCTDEHRSVNLSPGQQWATVILQCIYTSVLIASRRRWFGPSWSKSPHVSNIQRLQTWFKLYVGNHPCSKENSGVWHHSWRDSLKSTLMSSQCVLGGHLLGCSVLGHIYLGYSAAGLGDAHEEAGHWAHCACSHPYHMRTCSHISLRPYHFVPMFLSLVWVPASLMANSDLARTIVTVGTWWSSHTDRPLCLWELKWLGSLLYRELYSF